MNSFSHTNDMGWYLIPKQSAMRLSLHFRTMSLQFGCEHGNPSPKLACDNVPWSTMEHHYVWLWPRDSENQPSVIQKVLRSALRNTFSSHKAHGMFENPKACECSYQSTEEQSWGFCPFFVNQPFAAAIYSTSRSSFTSPSPTVTNGTPLPCRHDRLVTCGEGTSKTWDATCHDATELSPQR